VISCREVWREDIRDEVASEALEGLLDELGASLDDAGGRVTITGSDPTVRSPHRLGAAAGAAVAALGIGVAKVWRMREGDGQDVYVTCAGALSRDFTR
jgi:ferric-dicitrate binding protein FerR (iron transport regulator)